jgi:NAD(P)-dependent dehydrogenase (short-subunit alcohol dehydrogenase family)
MKKQTSGGWMNTIGFENRVAIVTGAGDGIGRDYALDLAKRGAKVVVNDIGHDPDKKRRSVVEKLPFGRQAATSLDSVSTMAGGRKIIETALDHFGKVDILINNAGILRDRTFMKMTEKEWDDVIAVHLKGAFCVTQPAVNIMKDNQYPHRVWHPPPACTAFGQSTTGPPKWGSVL